jgi:hypothetical protein
MFSIIKNVKSTTWTRLADEHLETCMGIEMAEIKDHIDRLFKQNQF